MHPASACSEHNGSQCKRFRAPLRVLRTPVSYTHLDVYKRQVLLLRLLLGTFVLLLFPGRWRRVFSTFRYVVRAVGVGVAVRAFQRQRHDLSSGAGSRAGPVAVSYTHLDVYKRQASGAS